VRHLENLSLRNMSVGTIPQGNPIVDLSLASLACVECETFLRENEHLSLETAIVLGLGQHRATIPSINLLAVESHEVRVARLVRQDPARARVHVQGQDLALAYALDPLGLIVGCLDLTHGHGQGHVQALGRVRTPLIAEDDLHA
jgi:hypothetical protein